MNGTGVTDVFVLCGGLGTRIRGVIGDIPKPMALIGGKPFLQRLAEYLARAGFRRVVLGTGYRSELIEAHTAGLKLSAQIECSSEPSPMGTGGGLRLAAPRLHGDPVLVMNGDSFCPLDFAGMIAAHREHGAKLTVAVVRVTGSSDYGRIVMDDRSEIVAFDEKAEAGRSPWVNAGVYLFSREALEGLSHVTPLSLERDVFPAQVGRGLFGYPAVGPLVDIGTPERYSRACRELPALMGEA